MTLWHSSILRTTSGTILRDIHTRWNLRLPVAVCNCFFHHLNMTYHRYFCGSLPPHWATPTPGEARKFPVSTEAMGRHWRFKNCQLHFPSLPARGQMPPFSQWNHGDFSILILNPPMGFKRNIHRYTFQYSFPVFKIGTLVVWPAVDLCVKRHTLLINTSPNTTCRVRVYRRYFD